MEVKGGEYIYKNTQNPSLNFTSAKNSPGILGKSQPKLPSCNILHLPTAYNTVSQIVGQDH